MTLKNLTYSLLTAIIALLASACSEQDGVLGECGSGDGSGYTLSLYLDAGAAPMSRASDVEYQPGQGYENYIDFERNDFRVGIFDADDNFLSTLDPKEIVIVRLSGSVGSSRYELHMQIDPAAAEAINASKSVKVAVLANWRGNYPELAQGVKLDGLFDAAAEIAYTVLPTEISTADDKLPMYGVTQFSNISLKPDATTYLGGISMLRAVAKVEVRDDVNTSLHMTSVRLTRHTTGAAPMPKAVTHQDHYVKGNYAGDYVKHTSFPTAWGDDIHISDEAVELKKNDEGAYCVYVPEFNNVGSEAPARLELNFENLDASDFIDFKHYQDDPRVGAKEGDRFDIIRNNIYRFTVKKYAHGDINSVVDIIPYSSVELDPDFGLERDPINGWMVFRNDAGFLICYYDEEHHIFYDCDRQKITYSVHPEHPSWLRVVDARNNFAWYIDAENGKMYDENGDEMTDLKRHPVTGWLIRTLPDGETIDYYVAPISNMVFDRYQREVEMENRLGTNAYKLLRDGDGNILIRFDAITGKVYGEANNELTLPHDADGRVIINAKDGSVYCYYDQANASFYDAAGQKVKNPFTNPGWQQYLYSNGTLICYYDQVTNTFYDLDLDPITFEVHPKQPWFKVLDSKGNFAWWFDYETGWMYDENGKRLNPERDRTTGNLIRRGPRGDIAYYVDPLSLLVYDSKQEIVRLEHCNERTNALKVLNFEGTHDGPAKYYFDAAAGILYARDSVTVIYDRLHKDQAQFERDDKGRVIITNDKGEFFRYYDIVESKFYTEQEILVSNPFSVQLTPYDDIKVAEGPYKGAFTCFYNQSEGNFYDGYMRKITLREYQDVHPGVKKPWFEVVDHNGNFVWWVDFMTFKLYDANGNEISSPARYHNYNGTNVRITSGKRDEKTGRVEFLYYRGPNELVGTTSYWLDPLSLVMYDPKMCEVLLPRYVGNNTNSLKKFVWLGTLTCVFDCLSCQFYRVDPNDIYNSKKLTSFELNQQNTSYAYYRLRFNYYDNQSSYRGYYRPYDVYYYDYSTGKAAANNPFVGQK